MNLLDDPLLRVRTFEGMTRMSLPALLAALGREEVMNLPGIQRHQEDAFHVFLCCLAATILARRGDEDPVQDEAYWRSGLLMLAEGDEDAWRLVVDDPARPAFMQPPLPQADHARLKPAASTPDALDLLPTAKNHDLKQSRAAHPQLDEWIYALVSLQTMSGYYGRGNPGISRMNGGFGNRSIVELVHRHTPGGRWQDAVIRLQAHRANVLQGEWGYDPEGLALVWLEPWDGRQMLELSRLDPFYVEICRRVRLRGEENTIIHAESVPSEKNRIAAEKLKGVVGDAWLPVDLSDDKAGVKALTVSPQGLTPDLLRRLVFEDDLELTVLQRPLPGRKGPVWLSVSVLVRGQGTTDGFRERRILIPAEVRPRLFGPRERRDPLARLSRTGIEYAGKMQSQVLKPAIFAFIEGAPEKLQFDRDSAAAWWLRCQRRFDALWSGDYFPWLWDVPDPDQPEAALNQWVKRLCDHALTVLREAEQAMPQHDGRHYRSLVRAENTFFGALFRTFQQLKEENTRATGTHD
ncbi:CRISPR system Cascade subunit CasA [Methylomarinovum caldicuralii]|uniref:CRISPR system Cascade subunit CasA n=1 Tax=Methylomarinovum caldicuralii TaxID=438856 RepID=A0AAU9BV52_9GAMM|nr:type I-E CRISPR-associated protein Cse1/CasA [Methylomarinovum caldicuralii]BCX82601.1 CRISPR system Cascade subunit CasA [Methylomarinovum caldicuralii]